MPLGGHFYTAANSYVSSKAIAKAGQLFGISTVSIQTDVALFRI